MAFPSGAITLSEICDAYGVPRNMGALRGKTIFNADGTSSTVPATGAISINSFRGKYSVAQGLTWTASDNNPFSGGFAGGNGIAWNGEYWLAVGTDYSTSRLCILKSIDGVDWENPTNIFRSCYGIAWNDTDNYWVAVGTNVTSTATVCIAKSTNGSTWVDASNNPFSGSGGTGNGIAWNGEYWVAVGKNSLIGSTVSIAKSTDGMTWVDASNNPFAAGGGIAWNSTGKYWVAVGTNVGATVCIAKSTDGMAWVDASNNPFSGGSGLGIAWNGTYWVAVGRNSTRTVCIAKSTDGMTWTPSTNNLFSGGSGNGIAWNGTYWLAVGLKTFGNPGLAGPIIKSTDGMNWTNSTNNPFFSGSGGFGGGIAWNSKDNYWVAVGANALIPTVTIAKSNIDNNVAPSTPILRLIEVASTSMTISWRGATGVISYTYTISPSSGVTNIPTITSAGNGFVVYSGLTANTSYTVTITAVNTWGSSPSLNSVFKTDPISVPLGIKNWTEIASSSDGRKLVAIESKYAGSSTNTADGGYIYTSSDYGITWTQRTSTALIWRSVASSTDGIKLVACIFNGGIYTSINSGISWSVTSAATKAWTSVASSSDGIRLVATASNDGIYTSIDSGKSWIQKYALSRAWRSVTSSSDGKNLAACIYGSLSNNGYIYISTTYGDSWSQTNAESLNWNWIASSSDGQTLVACVNDNNGRVYIKSINSTVWVDAFSSIGNSAYSYWQAVCISSDGTKIVGAMTLNYIYTSTDSGTTWSVKSLGSTVAFSGISSSLDGKMVALTAYSATGGAGGYIYTSTDYGITWRASNIIAPLSPSLTLVELNLTNAKISWIGATGATSYTYAISPPSGVTNIPTITSAGSGFVVYSGLTANTTYTVTIAAINIWGSSSTNIIFLTGTTAGTRKYSGIAMSHDGTFIVACVNDNTNGRIYTSTNSGNSWFQTSAASSNWSAVACSSDGKKLVATIYDGSIYKSINSGVSWTETYTLVAYWTFVASSSNGSILAACNNNGIYISANSGSSWAQKYAFQTNWSGIDMSSDGKYIIACDNNLIHISTDSGETWAFFENISGIWSGITISDNGNYIVAVENNGSYYSTDNAGIDWISQFNGVTWTGVTSSLDGRQVIVCRSSGVITVYKSNDWGTTLTPSTTSIQNFYKIVCSSDGTIAFAVTQSLPSLTGNIYKSINTGNSWQIV